MQLEEKDYFGLIYFDRENNRVSFENEDERKTSKFSLRLVVARQRQTNSTSVKRWRSDFLFPSEILSTWTGVSSRRFDSVSFIIFDVCLFLTVNLSRSVIKFVFSYVRISCPANYRVRSSLTLFSARTRLKVNWAITTNSITDLDSIIWKIYNLLPFKTTNYWKEFTNNINDTSKTRDNEEKSHFLLTIFCQRTTAECRWFKFLRKRQTIGDVRRRSSFGSSSFSLKIEKKKPNDFSFRIRKTSKFKSEFQQTEFSFIETKFESIVSLGPKFWKCRIKKKFFTLKFGRVTFVFFVVRKKKLR